MEQHDEYPSGPFVQLMELERTAERLSHNMPVHVPGLMQTEAYAAAMIAGITGLRPGDAALADRVETRMRRAAEFGARLRGARPPALTVVIDEAVLLRRTGSDEVMREQIGHLARLAELPTVRLAVTALGNGVHPGLTGTFEVFEGGGSEAVFFESTEGDRLDTDPAVVRHFRERLEAVSATAESGPQLAERLEKLALGF